MSGGDLDGDQFFVCWDPELIPSTVSTPALYPGGRDPMLFRPITDDDRLVYFAKYTNASLGQVKNLYLEWARALGPMSGPCQELNRLFSQCVDGARIKIPEKLRNPPKPPQDAPPFVLDVLHDDAKSRAHSIMLSKKKKLDLEGYDMDAVHLLLSRDDVAMSEFEFVKLAHTWCRRHAASFESLLHLFDLNSLTAEQKAWVLAHLPPSPGVPALVLNALCTSTLLHQNELQHFHLDYPGIKWKRAYDSSIDRLANFHDAITTNLAMFQRTLIVFQPDERLSVAIYIPRTIEPSADCVIDNVGRLFAFPHTQGPQRQSRLALPTKMRYQVYCDGNIFQLFENQRANSWIYLARPGKNDEKYRNIQDHGDRRRRKQQVINQGKEAEVCASIALDKFSKRLQTHLGRINRSPVIAAEIYVISNRDTSSMRSLDLWLDYVDTVEKLPLFPKEANKYSLPSRQDVVSSSDPSWLVDIIANNDLPLLLRLESIDQYRSVLTSIRRTGDKGFLLQCFEHILSNVHDVDIQMQSLLQEMIGFLALEPTLVVAFTPFFTSLSGNQSCDLGLALEVSLVPVLRAIVLSANTMGDLILATFETLLANIPRGSLLLSDVADHIELVALTIRSTDLALDLLLGCLQPHADRLLTADPKVVRHLLRNLTAIAMDHIEEAETVARKQQGLLALRPYPNDIDGSVVEVDFKIDASGTPKTSSHVRLTTASIPENVPVGTAYSMDALVVFSETGRARFKCLHPLPPYFADCSWVLEDCGSFVTTKSTIDAVKDCDIQMEECCGIASTILGIPSPPFVLAPATERTWHADPRLNPSQNEAIRVALNHPLLCLWGPPGTGKTETIVEMMCALQMANEEARLLITAPTHNAVDNVMRRYVQRLQGKPLTRKTQPLVLRVSTEVRKVADDLRKYTCDALAGQEINTSYKALEKASQMIKKSNTVFTTCIGAGIGLLRAEQFDTVIVDEASQQTEPSSLVPLVKGCSKAILVGDHVQLRPTVHQTTLALDFDVSLFERLYNTDSGVSTAEGRLETLMLDTQYRMHPRLCEFSSKEFYMGNLKSGIDSTDRPLPLTAFPFPMATVAADEASGSDPSDREPAIFIDCASGETFGQKSKENKGQADLCLQVCKLLTTSVAEAEPTKDPVTTTPHSIAVLTPYSRQAELLKRMMSSVPHDIEVSSIDGFQGREADIVVFVTVRCNEHRNIGFLKDMRRMNVALTRSRTALIVIGNRPTLTEGIADKESSATWKRLLGGLTEVKLES